jgi:hypothetical protein
MAPISTNFEIRFDRGRAGASPVLDALGLTALGAWSLRKTRAAYAGSCIRVRRSSDNAEQDIGFVGGTLDAASLLAFTGANDGRIATWYDQSGNVRDLIQSTASNQPRIVAAGVMLDEIIPNTTNQRLSITNAAFELSTSAISVASVLGTTATGASALGLIWSFGQTSTARLFVGTDIGTRSLAIRPSGTNRAPSPVQILNTSGNVLALTKIATASTASISTYINNGGASTYASETFSAFAPTTFGINDLASSATYGAHGHKEHLVFGSVLSAAMLSILARNQGVAFGVSVA